MKNKSVPGYKRVFAWMIAVFAMVIPWISYLRIWKLTDAQADVFENYNGYVFDFFLYYREVLVVLAAIVMTCIMIGENIFPDTVLTQTPVRDRQNRKIWICFAVYTAAVLLSFYFQKIKDWRCRVHRQRARVFCADRIRHFVFRGNELFLL